MPKAKQVYKTNTRTVNIIGKTTIDLKVEEDKINVQVKIQDLASYLLWTRDYSQKWSNDVLVDHQNMINTIHNDILSKMGFVNVIKIDTVEVGVTKNLTSVDPKTHKPIKVFKTFA